MMSILYIHRIFILQYKHVMSLSRLPSTHPLPETAKPDSVSGLVELDATRICRLEVQEFCMFPCHRPSIVLFLLLGFPISSNPELHKKCTFLEALASSSVFKPSL